MTSQTQRAEDPRGPAAAAERRQRLGQDLRTLATVAVAVAGLVPLPVAVAAFRAATR